MSTNYGDVALCLPPDWARAHVHDQDFALLTVGHEQGVSDAYKTEQPELEHQFAWVDPKYPEDAAKNSYKGYTFVKKGEWTINERLWQWDAEGFCTFKTFKLMARPKDRFLEDMEQRRVRRANVMGKNTDDETAARIAAEAGFEITGDNGERLNRARPKNGMRNR